MPPLPSIRPRILVADTDPLTKALLSDLLSDYDADLHFIADGPELFRELSRMPADLIILNYGDPDEEGVEVCKSIRSRPELKDMPVLMITARDDRNTRLESLRAGADEFIGKPFDLEEVEARLAMILQAHRYRRMLQERRKLELVAEVAPGGLVIIDGEGTVQFVNATARRWLRAPESQEHWSFLDHCRSRFTCRPEPAWHEMEAFLQDQSGLVLIDGTSQEDAPADEAFRWIACEVRALDRDSSSGYLVALRDVTKETAERNLLWSLKSTLSHKLRTPCNGLLVPLELLAQEENLSEEAQSLIQIARESAERLERTMSGMVRFFDTHSIAPRRRYYRIPSVRQIMEKARQRGGVEVTVNVPAELQNFSCLLTPEELETVLGEVFENARRFHPEGNPKVALEAQANENGQVTFVIQDNGIHLNTAELQRIVQPFYQSERWHTGEVEGAGLGLNIVATLMWSAGGNLRIENRGDQPGLKVFLRLPVRPLEMGMEQTPGAEHLEFHI